MVNHDLKLWCVFYNYH